MCGGVRYTINNKMIIDDKVSAMSGDGDFKGEYNGISVLVSCIFKFSNGMQTCTVNIDGDYATTLKFDGTGLLDN